MEGNQLNSPCLCPWAPNTLPHTAFFMCGAGMREVNEGSEGIMRDE